MHFHDCFVQGCDASILIDGPSAEKTAAPNRALRGFEVIDDAKAQLEAACPGLVSCADILTLAARDTVVLTGRLTYSVPTGRRDGRISPASEAANLPGFRDSIETQKQQFADKGLTVQDLVTLVASKEKPGLACQIIFAFHWNCFMLSFRNLCRRAHHWDSAVPALQIQALQLHHSWRRCRPDH
uniref:peroxidase n=2 Tax=Kalanchoe fedtschenkoi TaxID=63787 RepID=A0A7N0TXN3_KALFE